MLDHLLPCRIPKIDAVGKRSSRGHALSNCPRGCTKDSGKCTPELFDVVFHRSEKVCLGFHRPQHSQVLQSPLHLATNHVNCSATFAGHNRSTLIIPPRDVASITLRISAPTVVAADRFARGTRYSPAYQGGTRTACTIRRLTFRAYSHRP